MIMLSEFFLLVSFTPTLFIHSILQLSSSSLISAISGSLHLLPHLLFAISISVPQIDPPFLMFNFSKRSVHFSLSVSSGKQNGNLSPLSLVDEEPILYLAHRTLNPKSTYS